MDILLLHRPDPLWEGEEIAEAFRKLHLSGKVRYFGVSNQNRFQMEYLQSFLQEALVANMVEMNLLHHGFVEVGISFNQSSPRYPDGWEGTMEYCGLKGVLLQAWSPLAQGILTGKLDDQPENVKETALLVRKYARKTVAFEELFLPHLDGAYNLARWIVERDLDAQAVVQEAYIQAVNVFVESRGADARAWLLTIVLNAAHNWIQKRGNHSNVIPLEEPIRLAPTDEPPPESSHDERNPQLHVALSRLPVEPGSFGAP